MEDEHIDRTVSKIVHEMVNSTMAIDLRLGVMEARTPSAEVSALRESTNDLLRLIRELEGIANPEPNP